MPPRSNANAPVVDFQPDNTPRPALDPASEFSARFRGQIEKPVAAPIVNPPAPVPAQPAAPVAPVPAAKDKPEPVKPADDIEEPPHVSEKSKSSWAKLRASDADAKQRATTAEQRVKELEERVKAAAVDPTEHEALKKRATEFEEKLIQLNVEQHPQFQAYFTNKVSAVHKSLETVLGDKAEMVKKILELPDGDYKMEQLENISVQLGSFKANRIAIAADQLAQIHSERGAEIQRSRENLQKSNEQAKAESATRQTQQRVEAEKVFNETIAALALPTLVAPANADDATKAEIAANMEAAKKLAFGENSPADISKMIAYSVHGMRLTPMLKAAVEENDKLRTQLKELQGANPKPAGGEKKPEGGEAPAGTKEPMTFAQRVGGMTRGEIALDQGRE